MAQRVRDVAVAWGRDIVDQPRLLLAAKTAIAAAIAWYLAPLVPFAAAEYSYYAPLGVLVSMYPTLARSARSGALALLGVAIGIGTGVCGLLLVWADVIGVVAVALVVGAGVALGGVRALGPGRDLIAMAGLFTLLLGGARIEEFSISYLVTMAFGVVVGVAVNLLVFPPLYLQRASDRLSALRAIAVRQLREIADAAAHGAPSAEDVERGLRELGDVAAAVAGEVREADESRRANPRARGRVSVQEENDRRLRALERTTASTRELAGMLLEADDLWTARGEPLRRLLAEAIGRVADLVELPIGDAAGANRLAEAEAAVARFREGAGRRYAQAPAAADHLMAAAVYLGRIVDASRPFV